MSTPPSTVDRFRPYSVPISIFALVALAVVVVPPVLLGDPSGRTYALTAAWIILAVWAALPYALTVGLVTLPLVYAGIATYAAPSLLPGARDSASPSAVIRHSLAGVAYILAAGVVGAVGLGAGFTTANEPAVPTGVLPSFTLLAGGVVGACFVGLQLWRHGATARGSDTRTTIGTIVLGLGLVPAGRVAVWLFQHGVVL